MSAILLKVGPDGLERTSGLISKGSDATYSWWASIPANPSGGDFSTLLYYGDDPQTLYADYIWIGANDSGQLTVEVGISSPASTTNSPFVFLEEGTYYFTYRRTGDLHELLCDGVVLTSVSQSLANFAVPTHQYLGTDTFSSDTFNSNVYEYREWNLALLDSELILERDSSTPVRTSGLVVDCPLLNDLLDDSGNGNNWSNSNGFVAFTQDPQNTSFETAIRLPTLPATRSDNAHEGGTTFTLYYKYTALSSGELAMGVFGFGDLITYQPVGSVFVGSLSAPTTYLFLNGQDNVPWQMPVEADVRYLFEFVPNAGNPTPAVLELSAITAPTQEIPTGTLFVNDDTNGYPGVFITPNPGVVNFASPFPNGEGGDNLFSGIAVFEDFQNNQLAVYNGQFEFLRNISFGNGFTWIRANHVSLMFYAINNDTPPTYIAIDSLGFSLGTVSMTGEPQGVAAIATNNADTILYWANPGAAMPVRRWDIGGATALSNFVAGISGESIAELLFYSDGTILVGSSGGGNLTVRRYNESGTLLDTYVLDNPLLPAGTLPRIATAVDEPDSFWAWTHENTGISRWRNVKISDGSIITNITLTEYELGIYRGDETSTPTARFGDSFSCPFVTTKVPIPQTNNPPLGGPPTIVVEAPITGGLYQLVPDKTDDTLWIAFPDETEDVAIP